MIRGHSEPRTLSAGATCGPSPERRILAVKTDSLLSRQPHCTTTDAPEVERSVRLPRSSALGAYRTVAHLYWGGPYLLTLPGLLWNVGASVACQRVGRLLRPRCAGLCRPSLQTVRVVTDTRPQPLLAVTLHECFVLCCWHWSWVMRCRSRSRRADDW